MKLKLGVVILCSLLLSGCVVSKAKLDEAMTKISTMENEVRNKSMEVDRNKEEIVRLDTANKALTAELEKNKQTSEAKDAELASVKNELAIKCKEVVTIKADMAQKLGEKDKQFEDLHYKVKEIQARAESLVEKIKLIQ